jgi:tryptophanyl-tRNA synthetase
MTTRMLTGIQPSGELHLGNYFGAVRPCLRHQEDSSVDLLVFLADFHALTTVHDGRLLRSNSRRLAKDLLALGLDHRTTLFRQSDLPQVTELALMLSMGTGMGLLQRAHSYKDKVDNGITPTVGLFFYPVLMAADILLYRADRVPVGRDQVQHVEMARDMATRFNEEFGQTLDLPEALVSDAPKVPGIDGRKMSKSYGNTISPFDEGDELAAKVAAIKTSSTPFGEPLPTEDCVVLALLELLGDEEAREFFTTGRRGSNPFGYGHAKQLLTQRIDETFADARERRRELTDRDVDETLAVGAWKASDVAQMTLEQCRAACGVGHDPELHEQEEMP